MCREPAIGNISLPGQITSNLPDLAPSHPHESGKKDEIVAHFEIVRRVCLHSLATKILRLK